MWKSVIEFGNELHMVVFDPENGLFWIFGGQFPPNQALEAKKVPTTRDPFMSRYYHLKLVSELKNEIWIATKLRCKLLRVIGQSI